MERTSVHRPSVISCQGPNATRLYNIGDRDGIGDLIKTGLGSPADADRRLDQSLMFLPSERDEGVEAGPPYYYCSCHSEGGSPAGSRTSALPRIFRRRYWKDISDSGVAVSDVAIGIRHLPAWES